MAGALRLNGRGAEANIELDKLYQNHPKRRTAPT